MNAHILQVTLVVLLSIELEEKRITTPLKRNITADQSSNYVCQLPRGHLLIEELDGCYPVSIT
jgi:hypothetical protein